MAYGSCASWAYKEWNGDVAGKDRCNLVDVRAKETETSNGEPRRGFYNAKDASSFSITGFGVWGLTAITAGVFAVLAPGLSLCIP